MAKQKPNEYAMSTYMFVIDGVPYPENEDCADVAGAKIHVYVVAESMETAKEKAIKHINEHRWSPLSFEYEFLIDPARLPEYHKDEVLLYARAQHCGISADFVA